MRVLIVDDNRDAADSLALMLALSGHEVHTANDGAAALSAVAAGFDHHLTKPADPERLWPVLDAAVAARKSANP